MPVYPKRNWPRIGTAVWLLLLALPPVCAGAESLGPQVKLAKSRPGRGPLTVRALVYSPVPLGAYTLQVSFDPAVLELVAIDGGKSAEFSAAPIANPQAFATGTVRFSAFQTRRLDGPSGRLHVATLRFQPKGNPGGGSGSASRIRSTNIAFEITTLADTDGRTYAVRPRTVQLRYRVP